MKRIIFVGVIAMTLVASSVVYFQKYSKASAFSELVLANIEALAETEHGGGTADKHCPIWEISYTTSFTGVSVTCTTGGDFRCEAGQCPHE